MAQNLNEELALTAEVGVAEEHAPEPFYASAEFWVGVAFVIVVVALFKPVGGLLKNMLIQRRERIIAQIDEAQKLRDDAQLLLADYEKKFMHAQEEADAILTKAQADILQSKRTMTKALNNALKKRTAEAERNMQLALEKAQEEIYAAVGQKTAENVELYMAHALNAKKHSALIDASIDQILKNLPKK